MNVHLPRTLTYTCNPERCAAPREQSTMHIHTIYAGMVDVPSEWEETVGAGSLYVEELRVFEVCFN